MARTPPLVNICSRFHLVTRAGGRDHSDGVRPAGPMVADSAVRQGASTTIQSVRRAAKLLVAVATQGRISARQASTEHSLTLPTAYHLLNSLASEGLLTKDRTGGYVLGPLASVIGEAVGRDIRPPQRHIDAMRKLVEASGETAYLTGWRSGEARILSVAEGTQMIRVSGMAVGYSHNLHARTSVRVLLAHADPQFRAEQVELMRLRRLTPKTITSREQLFRDLETIRSVGIAIGRDEYVRGLTCASAPIIENDQVVSVLTIAVPSDRFRESEESLVLALRSAAGFASTAE
jgi:IclR family transcriptional regulator, acetate operon repressor